MQSRDHTRAGSLVRLKSDRRNLTNHQSFSRRQGKLLGAGGVLFRPSDPCKRRGNTYAKSDDRGLQIEVFRRERRDQPLEMLRSFKGNH